MNRSVKVAVVQAAPILFDKTACIEKACRLIREAGENGSQVVLLPEAFIPAYPRGFSFGMVVGSRSDAGRALWQRYWENSIEVPSQETAILGTAVREAGVYLAIGVTERESSGSRGTLFCTLLYFDPTGNLIGKHRKLKPTGAERLIWGEGDGSTLPVFDTDIGKIGGLICWENYMPEARMKLYRSGVDLYVAPTADARDSWTASMRHIACESRSYVLSSNQYFTKGDYDPELQALLEEDQPEVLCRGGSCIVSPYGEILAGPLYDQEGSLIAEIDRNEIIRSRMDFDVTGHYRSELL